MSGPAAVTGLGVVSPFGWGAGPFAAGIFAGTGAIGGFDRFDHAADRTHVAGQVPPEPPGIAARHPGWRRLTLAERFAVAAAAEAVDGVDLSGRRAGVFFSSSTGGMLEGERFYAGIAAGSRPRLELLVAQQVSAPGEAVARALGVTGPVETVSSACASGTLALGLALDALRAGEVDLAVAGGADVLCRITYSGFNSLRSVEERPCRPFRADRAGLSLGEGAAVLVLERLDDARARGARSYAEVAGYGLTCDAHHMTAAHPEGDGLARAMLAALADAGATPSEVDYVSAHGTGTPTNDKLETLSMQRVFGDAAGRVPVSSIKSMIGHTMGAASAFESAVCALAVATGRVPPTINYEEPDPECALDCVPNTARELPVRLALNNAAAFGGNNASVAFREVA